jgi:acetylornithine deacetylase/succinyl-diaminopimelate desuccinylase-like protein
MEHSRVKDEVSTRWQHDVVPILEQYVSIPALSPSFDSAWESHGKVTQAANLLADWARRCDVRGATVSVRNLAHRTPVIVVDIPAYGIDNAANTNHGLTPPHTSTDSRETVLMYGHLDKQPEMEGWLEGLGPWTPIITDGKLYGRGAADDGYALFASLTAIQGVQRAGGQHARIVILIEASEESGSPDLGAHIEQMQSALGDVTLVVCLDSGCATYDRLWTTTSLRGLATIRFTVRVLTEGVHSGNAGGVVPSSFRIARLLLDRLEDVQTGELRLPELLTPIPEAMVHAATSTADLLGPHWAAATFPWIDSTCGHASGHPEVNPSRDPSGDGISTDTTAQQLLNRTWRGAFEVIGADGIPASKTAGNVLRPSTTLSLAVRLSPTADTVLAAQAITRALTTDVPYGASVEVNSDSANGWAAPELASWMHNTLEDASMAAYGTDHRSLGEGGSIPFMGMLAQQFPKAQFAVAGVLGPASNAHGPNEFLHLDYAERLTVAVAHILNGHATRDVVTN